MYMQVQASKYKCPLLPVCIEVSIHASSYDCNSEIIYMYVHVVPVSNDRRYVPIRLEYSSHMT